MYKIVVEGKGGIVARVVADSVSKGGKRITTFELEYHRFIHAELLTHRLFSRNAMSSRAVPIKKMIEQVRNNPATPIHWGKNQAGMQAENELDGLNLTSAKMSWERAAHKASVEAEHMNNYGAHKQIVNRLLEPFQMMKTVLTATEFDNFFWLRCHKDAQPEIKELADCMYKAMQESEPEVLKQDEWHTPYVQHERDWDGELRYVTGNCDFGNDPETALRVSASCCAQVSYRVLDDSLEKALDIYDKLVESKPVHASPFEHQATPMEVEGSWSSSYLWNYPVDGLGEIGHTHMAKDGSYWSGNLCGWIQHRQLIEDNVCNKYDHI
jgi:thymidylate synthase ThyX